MDFTNLRFVTQDDEEVLGCDNQANSSFLSSTMAKTSESLPSATFPSPSHKFKKTPPSTHDSLPCKPLRQLTLFGKVLNTPRNKTSYSVSSHVRKNGSIVSSHVRKISPKGKSPVWKGGKSRRSSSKNICIKVKDDCPESVQLAHSLHIKELQSLIKASKEPKKNTEANPRKDNS